MYITMYFALTVELYPLSWSALLHGLGVLGGRAVRSPGEELQWWHAPPRPQRRWEHGGWRAGLGSMAISMIADFVMRHVE